MNSKLSSRDAEFIRVFEEFGISKPALATEYGIHVDTVRNVILRRSFRGKPIRSGLRKLTDEQVRQVRQWAAPPPEGEGLGEARIQKRLGGIIGRSTVRQVINRQSYRDVV